LGFRSDPRKLIHLFSKIS
jgi:hypothetical protein